MMESIAINGRVVDFETINAKTPDECLLAENQG